MHSNRPTQDKLRRIHSSRYVPSIDGLRAFAVLAVIAYHMKLGWAPGGLMGVTIFFVISGYLINGLLIAEHDQTGTISLKSFWLRRIRRLFPAIFLSVVGTAALCTLFDHTLLDKMRPDIAPSLLFYNNWWQIFRDISYFEAAGDPSPLTHFWSLSIEEQFYVVWPLLLVAMLKLGARKKTVSWIALGLAIASAIEMTLLYTPQGDPSRIYYGTDTRALSLLVGVWLSIAWPSAAFGKHAAQTEDEIGSRGLLNVIGVVALAGLVAIVVVSTGFSDFPYYGGVALTTMLTAALIVVLVVPGTWMARLFAIRPLVWIGKRSYGMYLWHFPILLLTTDANSTTGTPWWMHLVQVALIFTVSALSYTFIENPIRKGAIGRWWRARSDRRNPDSRIGARAIVPGLCFVALLVVAGFGVAAVSPTDYAATLAGTVQETSQSGRAGASDGATGTAAGESSSASEDASDVAAGALDGSSAAASEGSAEGASSESSESETSASSEPSQASPASSSDASGSSSSASTGSASPSYDSLFLTEHLNSAGEQIYEPLLIGDSVSAGAIDEFYETYPYGHIDSVVSRNIWESPYVEYLDADRVGTYVVFCLGTNNAVVDWQIDNDLLGPVSEDKKVIMVNTRNVRDWMAGTNAEIAAAAERHPNLVVVDWYGASEGHDEYFAGDGTHLTREGARAYIALIDEAIRSTL